MSFWAYLYLLRASFRKFFNSREAIATVQDKTKFEAEVNVESKEILRKKCVHAALEIQYISNFTHWPIAKAKSKTQKNSLVYLDVNRSKRAPLEQRNKRGKNNSYVNKKSPLTNRISTVKKIPNQ